jgi:hypothetical protein
MSIGIMIAGPIRRDIGMNMIAIMIGIMTEGGIATIGTIGIELGANAIEEQRTHGKLKSSVGFRALNRRNRNVQV